MFESGLLPNGRPNPLAIRLFHVTPGGVAVQSDQVFSRVEELTALVPVMQILEPLAVPFDRRPKQIAELVW